MNSVSPRTSSTTAHWAAHIEPRIMRESTGRWSRTTPKAGRGFHCLVTDGACPGPLVAPGLLSFMVRGYEGITE